MKTHSISKKISAWKKQIKTDSQWWAIVEEFAREMTSFMESSKDISAESQNFLDEAVVYLDFSIWLNDYAEMGEIVFCEDSRWEKFEFALLEIHNKLSSVYCKLRKSD